MRVKETGNDYRYFPEPDIPYFKLDDDYINNVLKDLGTNADFRRQRYKKILINNINVDKIIANKDISDYLELITDKSLKTASNLLLGDISAYLNKTGKSIYDTKLIPSKMEELVTKIDNKEISTKNFKDIILDVMESDLSISDILEKNHILNVVDNNLVLEIINKVINDNLKVVEEFLEGKDRSFKYLMGQVMKESHGSVNPSLASDLLKNEIFKRK